MSTPIKWDWEAHDVIDFWSQISFLWNNMKHHSNHWIDSLSFSEMWIKLWYCLLKETETLPSTMVWGNNAIYQNFTVFLWRVGVIPSRTVVHTRASVIWHYNSHLLRHLEAGDCIETLTPNFITCARIAPEFVRYSLPGSQSVLRNHKCLSINCTVILPGLLLLYSHKMLGLPRVQSLNFWLRKLKDRSINS